MAGVVMLALGPGRGPVTPMDLITAMTRPLGDLLVLAGVSGDPAVDDLVLLDEFGELHDAALESGCEFVGEVLHMATAPAWLPRWSWMRAEQVEQAIFRKLVDGTDEQYRASRRFLVEHPAGEFAALVAAANESRAERVAPFVPLGPGQRFLAADDRLWWWPCPVCRWPMRVSRTECRCVYRPHRAVYDIDATRARPRLQSRAGAPRPPAVLPVTEMTKRVEESVWRYITVPGSTELRLAEHLRGLGATVTEWPDHDSCDLLVETQAGGHLRIEIKEYTSVDQLVERLRTSPPRADVLVVPDTHRQQCRVLRDALPGLDVWLPAQLSRRVALMVKEST